MQPRILFIYPQRITSVKTDVHILQKHYNVEEYSFGSVLGKLDLIVSLLKQFVFLLFTIRKYDILLCKMIGYSTLIPVIFGRFFKKKILLIPGGHDTVSFPSIGYGNFQGKMVRIFTKFSYKWSTYIIAFHPSVIYSEYTYTDCVYPMQGIKFFLPKLRTPYTVIYPGFNSNFWKPLYKKKGLDFISVTTGMQSEIRRTVKGIDLVIEIAKYFKEHKFFLVGYNSTKQKDYPENVILIPKITQKELINFFSMSRFYLQLSFSEGFGNALCEAMLCECVPIGSNVGAIPFIINDTGFILKKKNTNQLLNLINEAVKSDTDLLGKKARERIKQIFTIEKREDTLLRFINNIYG